MATETELKEKLATCTRILSMQGWTYKLVPISGQTGLYLTRQRLRQINCPAERYGCHGSRGE